MMIPGICASLMALSMDILSVTQTGHPGPDKAQYSPEANDDSKFTDSHGMPATNLHDPDF